MSMIEGKITEIRIKELAGDKKMYFVTVRDENNNEITVSGFGEPKKKLIESFEAETTIRMTYTEVEKGGKIYKNIGGITPVGQGKLIQEEAKEKLKREIEITENMDKDLIPPTSNTMQLNILTKIKKESKRVDGLGGEWNNAYVVGLNKAKGFVEEG